MPRLDIRVTLEATDIETIINMVEQLTDTACDIANNMSREAIITVHEPTYQAINDAQVGGNNA